MCDGAPMPHPRTPHGATLSRATVVLMVMACVTSLLVSGASAEGDPPGAEPGLPYLRCLPDPEGSPPDVERSCGSDEYNNAGTYLNFPQIGLAGSVKAQQWTRVPLTMTAASVLFYYVQHPSETPGERTGPEFWYEIRAFFVSPKGSKDNYGDSAVIPVRTVAFGSIPVTATLQVSQERDENDLPVPLRLTPHDYRIKLPAPLNFRVIVDPATTRARVTVRVKKLVVDGVDVGLGTTCRTAEPSTLTLSSKELVVDQPLDYTGSGLGKLEDEFDPTIYQYGIQGGTLQGSIDIGRFGECTTRTGDDLSPLLTSALSEDDAPVAARVGATNCQIYDAVGGRPIPPGVNDPDDPRAGCFPSPHPNPKIVTVPQQFDMPDRAPEPARP